MSDFNYEIIKHMAILSTRGKAWQQELNLVKWGNNKPKYDIRDWMQNHKRMGKGITLTFEELEKAVGLLQQNLGELELKSKGVHVGDSSYGCELILECGEIADNKKGWTKEVNIVKWGENNPKFDLRSWGPNKKAIGKGSTLNLEATLMLINTFSNIIDTKSDSKKRESNLDIKDTSIEGVIKELFI
jgi:hypothetical protein